MQSIQKIGVVMDPISSVNINKDSTFAMLLEAQRRHYVVEYMTQTDLFAAGDQAKAMAARVSVQRDPANWFQLSEKREINLGDLDVILMRKDPPFDMNFIYTTYLLDLAAKKGAMVVNNPGALRDANEKAFITQFPECIAPTLISSRYQQLEDFLDTHNDVIFKPLDGMGGRSIFRVGANDQNTRVILETLTEGQQTPIMAQRFIPQITAGDKRVLIIDGVPVEGALARIPQGKEHRGNLAAGGRGETVPLSDRDHWIVRQLAPALSAKGLIFVGIDIIGDYLTEINVTSPTCIQELDKALSINIAGLLFDAIEKRVTFKRQKTK